MWFCPTFQRPEGLRRLADSWEKYAPDMPLAIRIWEHDPKREEYGKYEWPKNWEFYVSDTEYFSPALNEFFAKYPNEETYGFIADDMILTGQGSLEHLDALASPFFIAYPNDTIQRHVLPTHYSIGGELVRTMGWFAAPFLKHCHTDMVWKLLGLNCGLLRYAPQIVFYHNHYLRGRTEYDATYQRVYDEKGNVQSKISDVDNRAFDQYVKGEAIQMDVRLIKQTLLWVENQVRKEAGLDEEAIPSYQTKPVVPTGNVSGGVGGRDGAGSVQELDGEVGRVQGDSAPEPTEGTPSCDSADPETGAGLPARGCPFPIEKKEYTYPDARVLLAIPSNGEWASGTAVSSMLLVADFMQHGLPGLRSRQLHINSTESSMLVANRHNAVRTMLQVNSSHLLFIDSDMKFPPWALRRLLSHDLPFVAANCTKRGFPVVGTAFDFDGEVVNSNDRSGLEVVRQVGLAFALIRRDVFEKLRPPLFMMEWVEDMKGYCGEDIYFCQLVQDAGYDIVIDHEMSKYLGHIGSFVYGHNQVGATVPGWLEEGK